MVSLSNCIAVVILTTTNADSGTASDNCTELHYGVGMHGSGSIDALHTTLEGCCNARASHGAEAFTYHNTTGECVLSGAPLNYHISSGTADAISGCAHGCPTSPSPGGGTLPGPAPSSFPANATFPQAMPTMPSSPTFPNAPRPNIVLFFGDDIGFGDLGCFGNPTSETPYLDAMAAEGAKLVQYYSAASICSPSRGALMTGRNFVRIGVYPGVFSPDSISGLFLNETTVAAKFKTVGYRTGMCGKWHLGTREYHPTHHGFDVYYGAPMTQNECYSNLIAPGSITKGGAFGPCPWFNGSSDIPTWQSTGVFPADPHAVDMVNVDEFYDASLEGFVREAVSDKVPFFWYFASHHTHAPQFAACQTTGDSDGDDANLASNCTTKRGLFGDSLALLDRSVGRLHALLDELDIANNTLTIMSADNGGSLHWGILGGVNGDLRCGKGTLWEGGVRVPAIVRWPGVVRANQVVQEMTSSLDWMPTFSALAGYKLDTDKVYDGWDMSGLLFSTTAQCDKDSKEACIKSSYAKELARRDRYFYHTSEDSTGDLVAVRLGPWKLHFLTKGSHCDDTFPDAECYAPPKDRRPSGGLLFNVERDMSEVLPLSNTSYEYRQWAPVLWAMAIDYTTRVFPQSDRPPSQIGRGNDRSRFPCCDKCSPMPDCCSCTKSGPSPTYT